MATDTPSLLLVLPVLAAVALLYSSVGHAGASGYIAALTLFDYAPAVIKPTALLLNIFVATIATIQFARAGFFSWPLFWPFAAVAVPAAFLGGYLHLPAGIFKPLVGLVLLFSAVRLVFRQRDPAETRAPSTPVALGTGAGIGLLAGLTGTGGGIFLTPLLLFLRWSKTRQAAATSAPFILVNSTAGLLGHVASHQPVPHITWLFAVAAVAGGLVGSHLGSRHFSVRSLALLLATVLVIAGVKLLFTS